MEHPLNVAVQSKPVPQQARLNSGASHGLEAWTEILASVQARLEAGHLDRAERQLSLAMIADVEEDLERTLRALKPTVDELRRSGLHSDIESAREDILDQLVRLRVALTANISAPPER